jgi:hypothetical protein
MTWTPVIAVLDSVLCAAWVQYNNDPELQGLQIHTFTRIKSRTGSLYATVPCTSRLRPALSASCTHICAA